MAQMSADQVPDISANGQFRSASVNLDAGPPPWADGGGPAPAWSQPLVQVPGIGHPVAVYSVHMPARSAEEQQSRAQRLASLIAQKGEIAIAGGDWNNFPGTLLKADRYPSGRRAVTSCSVI